jgi:conjugative transfer signal peptidase TraF
MKRWPTWFVVSLSGVGIWFAGCCVAGVVGYRLNATTSLPPGLWRIDALPGALVRSQIVSVCPSSASAYLIGMKRGYLRAGTCPSGLEPLFKPVAAVGGDIVDFSAEGMRVNGSLLPKTAPIVADGEGRPMPLMPFGRYAVGADEVWLVSTYNRWSFDSRYFGPVALSAVQGTATPVLVEDVPEAWR